MAQSIDHAELIKTIFVIHGPVLVAGLAALYRYGDRTEIINRSLEGSENLLKRMRDRIAAGMKKSLKPMLQFDPSPIIIPAGRSSYAEHPLSVDRSDAFIGHLDDFVYENSTLLADYRLALGARTSWCFWARWLSWSSLGLVVWQSSLLGAVGLLDCLCSVKIPHDVLVWAGLPTALIVGSSFLSLSCCLRRHDTISRLRILYDAP